MIRTAFVLAAAIGALAASSAAAQDGSKVFAMQCKLCHAAASGPMGPTLVGVAGAKIAARTDYEYSPALAAKGGTWTDANLDAYLTAPGKFASGTRMAVAVTKPADRAAVISYLKTVR
ncbi:cytochrome c family protein [Phenylobacterium sp.]|uniref:c-type cytochrome n=1 Tax=Phenylobacterium sp. TaxID=1871053 RepID=UPI0027332E7A|nr:c-type cytochrome [Phenylobacterium sp.]MDP3659891.1 c-type cytochrome [Phenylobacterium sp.]